MQEKHRVLIVDDDLSWQNIYQEILEDKGYEVRKVDRLTAAVDAINRYFFHVAIVDIRLKNGSETNRDGMGVLEKIWQLDEGTTAIVISGYVESDMFADFRKFGIFNLTEKSSRTAGDALQEYREAEFIRGPFVKGQSLEGMMQIIDQACTEAQRKISRQRWLVSPFSLIRGLSAREIQQELHSGHMTEIRPLLASLCRPLYPWLKSRQEIEKIKENDALVAIETRCWSRGQGKPMKIVFGRREWIENHLDLGGAEGLMLMPERGIAQRTTAHFQGAIYPLLNVDLQDDFELPASRRMTKCRLSSDC